jgi:glycosyltransferase involved in cell wall biosynthesis
MRLLLTADPEVPVPPIHYGGIERIVDALVRFYVDAGHEVCLLSHPESRAPATRLVGWPGRSSTGMWNALQNATALHRTARDFGAEIVHSFSRLAYLAPLLPAKLPKLMSYQRHTGGRQISWAARAAGRSLRFTGCSEFICRMGRPAGGVWDAIPNFVETAKIDFVPHVPNDAPLVFLSRVESIKGPDVAIAVARASGRRLVIAGNHATDGAEGVFWNEQIAPHLGQDGIEYVGPVNDAEKYQLLGGAAALIVPIRWDEPFGIVFPEALAAGTPVISCARGALPEIIDPGRTGFFMKTVDEGVDAVRRLSDINRAACRRIAEERFTVITCANRYLELYRDLIATVCS